jgi:hypothetical protein
MVSSEGARESRKYRQRGTRGQANPIGVTLVLAFAIMGSVTIVALGATVLGDAQQNLGEDRAEKALTQFDSKAALVALGNTDTQTLTFAQEGGSDIAVENGTGWMRITIDNQTDSSGPVTLLNQSLGSVVYERGGTTLAYQGGGVWRRQGNNSQMISPPEFHFRNGTLTLPVINVTGDRSLSDSTTITHKKTTKAFPNRTQRSEFVNPLTEHEVTVTVHSDYYRGWGSYFEERTDGEVDYDHERNLVNLTLVTPLEKDSIDSAAASLSASGEFVISGSPATSCQGTVYTDSYNSENSEYCSGSTGDNGDILYGGDVDISKGSGSEDINGDVVSGGTVEVGSGGGQPEVFGNINYTISCLPDESRCKDKITSSSGTVNQIDGVDSAPNINGVVNRTVYEVMADNDNADSGVPISGNEIDFGGSDSVTLEAGAYYLENLHFDGGDHIEFDTSSGNITLAIRGDVEMPADTWMEVTGDDNVKVYVNGESASENGDSWTWDMNEDTNVTNAGDDSAQFRVYGHADFSMLLDSGQDDQQNRFVGAIFAPPGSVGTGKVVIEGGHIFGGILTGTTKIQTPGRGAIHYDEALENKRIISRSARIVKVTYLHISVNEITVTS